MSNQTTIMFAERKTS